MPHLRIPAGMRTELFLDAPPLVQVHAVAAGAALALGLAQLLRRRGTPSHRLLGACWVLAMATVCVSSFGIRTLMPRSPVFGFSPIHLLSLWTLYALAMGVRAAHAGDARAHGRWMSRTFFFALLVAGLFTLLPGRLMYRIVFG